MLLGVISSDILSGGINS